MTVRATAAVVVLGLLFSSALVFPLSHAAVAMAAEIVARIDGEIITEHDVLRRSVRLQKRLAKPLPALRIAKKDRQAFALDLLLRAALQRHYLIEERALPVTNSAVEKRLLLLKASLATSLATSLGSKAEVKTERLFWQAFARHDLIWEGYVGRVAEFNSPVTPEDTLEERARLRASASEPRYRIEEIFLPRLEGGESASNIANALYRSLRRGGSFARVAKILPAPYAYEGPATRVLYRSALPPAVLDALERRKIVARVGIGSIVPPITSPYGVHLYRITRQGSDKTTTRYSFVQTFFLQSGFGARQAAILSDPEFCRAPQDASLSLGYYDLQSFDDVPEADLNPDLKRSLATLSRGETAGPFPFSQGLVVLVTLCDKQRAAERGDSFEELTNWLQLKRAQALSLRLVESLRAQAGIEKQGDKTLSALPEQ